MEMNAEFVLGRHISLESRVKALEKQRAGTA
jgi:hypothetical protein